MVEERIVEQCAPTLAGIKCGSLFRTDSDIEETASEVELLNRELNPLGVIIATFRPSGCGTLVYVYRKDLLSRISGSDERSLPLLSELGYDLTSTDALVGCLRRNVESIGCVPHEIGLFLGYPYDDVKGFMDNKGRCPKCMGCWKVYGSVERANELFSDFRRCRTDYRNLYESGVSIEELTVA